MDLSFLNNAPKARLVMLIRSLISRGLVSESDIGKEFSINALNMPSYVFTKDSGILESTVRFLKEEYNMKFSKIAKLLNRDQRTIWVSYNKSSKKPRYEKKDNFIIIPISVISNRNYPPLKSLVKYMREDCSLKYSEISRLISRDQRTVWLTYNKKGSKRWN